MDQRKFKKPGRSHRKPQTPSVDLRQPLNLMQLMRRRSRYRPYSVNNTNNRLKLDNFPVKINNRNRPNREHDFCRPLFGATDSLGRHDMAVNTEMPCCSLHFTNSLNENQASRINFNELEDGFEEDMLLEYNEGAQEQNQGPENIDQLLNSEFRDEPTNTVNTLTASKSKESKSPENSSSDYSGSSVSYSERDHHAKKQNISDLKQLNFKQPQVNLKRISVNSSTLTEPADIHKNFERKSYNQSLKSLESAETFLETNLDSEEIVLSTKDLNNSPRATKISCEIFNISQISETDINLLDNNLIKPDTSQNTREANTDSEDSIIPDLSIVNDLDMMSSLELPHSSSHLFDNTVATRFAFVEVHSNTSASSPNNGEDQNNTVATDTEAGGDGHHNDSDIQIEFTITAIVNNDNEEDSNADNEEDEEHENETNNEEQEEDRDNEEI